MTVPMEQCPAVFRFVPADLPSGELRLGRQGACGPPRGHPPPLLQPLCLEVAADRRIRRHSSQLWPARRLSDQIVVMQLGAPVRMGGVLRLQRLAECRGHRGLVAGILARFAAEHAHRVGPLAQRLIVPSLDRGASEPDWLARRRMAPFQRRELLQL